MIINYPLKEGRKTQTPDRVIVHSMGEVIKSGFEIIEAHKFLERLGLSAHILITPLGDVYRLRNDNQGAHHAKGHNVNTLGIEFLVPGIHNYHSFSEAITKPYVTTAAYKAGLDVIEGWFNQHDIKSIARHSDIDPDRKIDPGPAFPWKSLLEDLGHA